MTAYEKLLAEFATELSRLQMTTPNLFAEIERCHKHCTDILYKMRSAIIAQGFADQAEEIRFFREIYVEPMAHLMYYTELGSYLVNRPSNNKQKQLDYLDKQLSRVDTFLSKHEDFRIYIQFGNTHLDPYYFTREHLKHNIVLHRYPYLKDKHFDTDKGYILAKIKGWGLYAAYLNNERARLRNVSGRDAQVSGLKFTDNPIEASELFYSLIAAGSFNHGNAKISELVRALAPIFGLEPKDIYKRGDNLKNRKEKVIYLQKLIDSYLRWLEEGDAL